MTISDGMQSGPGVLLSMRLLHAASSSKVVSLVMRLLDVLGTVSLFVSVSLGVVRSFR